MANALVSRSTILPHKIDERIDRMVSISARFSPFHGERPSYVLPKPTRAGVEMGPDGLPMPPADLRGVFGATAEEFLARGKLFYDHIWKVLMSAGFSQLEAGNRVLDFGCGLARVLRWFQKSADMCECWGFDIDAAYVLWCQQYLNPPFYFATTTTFPHLPFEDDYFDLIFAAGVFSYLSDLAETWLLELRRVLRPQGLLLCHRSRSGHARIVAAKVSRLVLRDTLGRLEC